MRWYEELFLPWIIDKVFTLPAFEAQRVEALREARGRTLELGFGSGASLTAYPPRGIAGIVALDPNPGMIRRARRRIAAARPAVLPVRAAAGGLPFRDGHFDTVVSNWTLCSIADLPAALAEVRRVLRPGGLFLFLEHGLSDDERLARWQRRLTPLQRRLAGGCRLDVPITGAISASGLRVERLERYEQGPGPRILTQMVRGAARNGSPAGAGGRIDTHGTLGYREPPS